MLVAALLGRGHVPGDVAQFLFLGSQGGRVHDLPGAGVDAHHLPIVEENHFAGVGQKGRDVRGQEVLAHAHAQDQGRMLARGVEHPRVVPADHDHGVGAFDPGQGGGERLGQRAFFLEIQAQKLGQHLGVGLGHAADAGLGQLFFDLLIILDDAVVDQGDGPGGVEMGMGVFLGGQPVGGPAGVAHARGGQVDVLGGELGFQIAELALGLDGNEVLALQKGHASGVVAPVFQAFETFDDDRDGRPVSAISDNAAHNRLSWRAGAQAATAGRDRPRDRPRNLAVLWRI